MLCGKATDAVLAGAVAWCSQSKDAKDDEDERAEGVARESLRGDGNDFVPGSGGGGGRITYTPFGGWKERIATTTNILEAKKRENNGVGETRVIGAGDERVRAGRVDDVNASARSVDDQGGAHGPPDDGDGVDVNREGVFYRPGARGAATSAAVEAEEAVPVRVRGDQK